MKKITFSIFALLVVAFNYSFSQESKSAGPKHENHFKDKTVESDDLKITFENIFAMREFCKMKMVLENKTSDFLVFRMDETTFQFAHGEHKAKDKEFLIKPHSKITKTLGVDGDTRYHEDNFAIKFDGIYRAPTKGESFTAENFRLPPAAQEFSTGPFKVKINGWKKESHSSFAEFKVTYTGKDIGIIDSYKLMVAIQDGREFPPVSGETTALLPGDSEKFVAKFDISTKIIDMQFETLNIIWKDTFRESKKTKVNLDAVNFELDPGKTAAQNK